MARSAVAPEPEQSADRAGLRYVTDEQPGITRRRRGKGFSYYDPDDRHIDDVDTLQRIHELAIPPAWENVWICPDSRGHLQATGRDAKGRKQYRYHPRWTEVRDKAKYDKMLVFARVLPKIRRRVRRDMRRRGLPRNKVLALVVYLLENTLIRVGNDEYAEENDSFGLTTLRDRHAKINGSRVTFQFQGKSGQRREVDLRDRRLARLVKKCQELPGQELFQYVNEDDEAVDVTSDDVNEYLREIAGDDFTAKDFRTWAGTALAARALREFEEFDSQAKAKRNVTKAIERVAQRLGNTTAVCRKCYVHPAVIDAYLDQTLAELLQHRAETELSQNLHELGAEEAAVLSILQQTMKRASDSRNGKVKSSRKPARKKK